jgi:EAL domain-containing protein (putative c-di-GMP-specific phosphodiesterase class I)
MPMQVMMSTTSGEDALTRASTYLLQYLHDETRAVWAVTSRPLGHSFPILGGDGTTIGYLSIASDAQFPAAYSHIGCAAAAALGILAAVRTGPRSFDEVVATTSLEAALVHGRVTAYFQPIVELESGTVVALEALARWQTVEGVLNPDAFLDILDRSGLLFELFERILDEALAFLADYRHRMPDLNVAVNLELGTVPAKGLTVTIAEMLERHDVRADQLTLKLNERLSYELSPAAVGELRSVGAMGVQLMVADFTTNVDLLGRLGGVPIGGAKLDRRHVSQLAVGEQQRQVVRSILERAAMSGLDIIAEGVETRAQHEHLIRLGCKFAQGYYFAVPQSPSSLDAVLSAPLATSW